MRAATLADKAMLERWLLREGKNSDFTGFLMNPMNICLIEGDGGAFFVWHGPGIYEVHVSFEQRGREVLTLSHRMLDLMRDFYGARIFWAAVPWNKSNESRKVRLFTRLMGWKSKGRANLATGLNELFISE
jgi:hypothetical protein